MNLMLPPAFTGATFELTDAPLDEPPRPLAAARRRLGVADTACVPTAIGQTLRLPRRGEGPNTGQ